MTTYKCKESFMSNTGKYYPISCRIDETEYITLSFYHQNKFEKIVETGQNESVEFEHVPEKEPNVLPDYTPVHPVIEELPREDNEVTTPKTDGLSSL
jgi:hypothetical protein